MKKLYLYLSALMLAFVMMGSAQAVPLKTLVDDQGFIIANDKRFDSFWWDSSASNSSLLIDFATLLSSIEVTALTDGGLDPGPGLSFSTNALSVTSNGDFEWIDLFFGFKVTVLDPNLAIKDASLGLAGPSLSGDPDLVDMDVGVFVHEKIGTTLADVNDPYGFGNLGNLANQFSWLDDNLDMDVTSDSTQFALQNEIYVSKNILIWADSSFGIDGQTATATLSGFEQRFSQATREVPEPGILMLLAVGSLSFVFIQNRRRLPGKL